MQKVKVVRASGMPVQLDNMANFSKEFREAYDKVVLKVLGAMDKAPDDEQARRMSKMLQRIESSLHKKYPVEETWDIVTEKSEWEDLVASFGPIMMSRDADGSLTYVIYDLEL
jgi:predicted ATP-binding protein involved in virulence